MSEAGTLCCAIRRKILLAPVAIAESECGVPDVALADFLVWDQKSPQGKSVITFRFCPWCGKPWRPSGAIVETFVQEGGSS